MLAEISQLNCTSHKFNAQQHCIFISKANGRTTVPTNFQNCLYTTFFYLTQNWKIKIFLLSYVRTIMRRLIFLDKPYVQIIFQHLKIECSWYTESIQLKFFFHKFRLCESNLKSTRKRTRKQSHRSSMILGFSNINS